MVCAQEKWAIAVLLRNAIAGHGRKAASQAPPGAENECVWLKIEGSECTCTFWISRLLWLIC
jgi:hypothetical protein